MSAGHRITYAPANGKHFAYCSCRYATLQHEDREDVDAEVAKHLRNVEIARAALGSRTPSLIQQRDHYRKMQNDPETSAHDAHMWGVLADELDQRLGEGGTGHTDSPLF